VGVPSVDHGRAGECTGQLDEATLGNSALVLLPSLMQKSDDEVSPCALRRIYLTLDGSS